MKRRIRKKKPPIMCNGWRARKMPLRWHNGRLRIPSRPSFPILTADTTVAYQNQILGKPKNEAHAAEMLAQLSATTHQVYTAVSVYWQGETRTLLQQSDVTFKTMSAAEIAAYIAGGEPMDKAGAYGIQGLGGVFVAHLQGSFTGVMGLPVFETVELLTQFGLAVPPFEK